MTHGKRLLTATKWILALAVMSLSAACTSSSAPPTTPSKQAADATPASTSGVPDATGAVDAAAVQSDLYLAIAGALALHIDHNSFTAATPERMASLGADVTFNTSGRAVAGEVSIRDASKNTIVLVGKTSDGATYCLGWTSGKQLYGTSDAKTVDQCRGMDWGR